MVELNEKKNFYKNKEIVKDTNKSVNHHLRTFMTLLFFFQAKNSVFDFHSYFLASWPFFPTNFINFWAKLLFCDEEVASFYGFEKINPKQIRWQSNGRILTSFVVKIIIKSVRKRFSYRAPCGRFKEVFFVGFA